MTFGGVRVLEWKNISVGMKRIVRHPAYKNQISHSDSKKPS